MSTRSGALHSASASGPIRTCIGCRQAVGQVELLRIACRDGVVTPDPQRRVAGRGGYLHRDPSCLAAAMKRRAFGRALRAAGELDLAPVREMFDALSPAKATAAALPPSGSGVVRG